MIHNDLGKALSEKRNPGMEEALCGGFPAAISGLNAALEVFEEEDDG